MRRETEIQEEKRKKEKKKKGHFVSFPEAKLLMLRLISRTSHCSGIADIRFNGTFVFCKKSK